MQSITGCNLRGLHGQSMAEAMQLLCQLWRLPHKLPKVRSGTSVGRAVSLSHDSGRAALVSHKQRPTNETFPANQAHLHTFSVRLNCQNRQHSVTDEVTGFDSFPGFIEDLMDIPKHEFHI